MGYERQGWAEGERASRNFRAGFRGLQPRPKLHRVSRRVADAAGQSPAADETSADPLWNIVHILAPLLSLLCPFLQGQQQLAQPTIYSTYLDKSCFFRRSPRRSTTSSLVTVYWYSPSPFSPFSRAYVCASLCVQALHLDTRSSTPRMRLLFLGR